MKALPDTPMERRLALSFLGFLMAVLAIYLVEFGLWWSDPARRLPFNGDRDGHYVTWGHVWGTDSMVSWKKWNFRQRPFRIPKPRGVTRVWVIGDSYTFGVGLAEDERYTERLQERLNRSFPKRRWEVLNFGLMGAPTVFERDLVLGAGPSIDADFVVLGFCYNDVDPARPFPSEEHRRFEESVGPLRNRATALLRVLQLPRLAGRLQMAVQRWGELSGRIPDYPTLLRRAIQRDAPAWKDFTAALRDIKAACDQRRRPVIFAVLLSGRSSAEFRNPTPARRVQAEIEDQAAAAAAALGFEVVRFEDAVRALPPAEDLRINPADSHPGRALQRIFADGLAEHIGNR